MIYVSTYALYNTGGPEALVQLALALSLHKNVTIFPVNIHARFIREYPAIQNLPQRHPGRANAEDIVILPEVERCKTFGTARVFIWLLSYNRRRSRDSCINIAHNSFIGRYYGNIPVIRPYITPSTVEYCRRARNMRQNRSTVLIDNDSPGALSQYGTIVRGYSRSRLLHMLSNARYIVDWNFIGTERMPIEGLLCGAYVLTSNQTKNCALGDDFHFPPDSFVHSAQEIGERIKSIPPLMHDAIVAFESLGPTSMWREARLALNIS